MAPLKCPQSGLHKDKIISAIWLAMTAFGTSANAEEYMSVAGGDCLKNEIGDELQAGGTLCVSTSNPTWCFHTYDGWKPKAPLVIAALNDPNHPSHEDALIIAKKVAPKCLAIVRSDRTQLSSSLHADLDAATKTLADVYKSAPEASISLKATDDALRAELQQLRADLDAARQELQQLKAALQSSGSP